MDVFLISNQSCAQDAIKFNIFSFSGVIRNINSVLLFDICPKFGVSAVTVLNFSNLSYLYLSHY